jgi:hypothetical protein
VPLGCTAEDIYTYGGCASAKEQKSKGRRLLRDLKYSGAEGETDAVVDEDNSLGGSEKLYYGYDVSFKVKNDVKKEVSYVPDRKVRGKNTLIGGVLITQYRSEPLRDSISQEDFRKSHQRVETSIKTALHRLVSTPYFLGLLLCLGALTWKITLENTITFQNFHLRVFRTDSPFALRI